MRLFNLKNTKEEMTLPELIHLCLLGPLEYFLYWTEVCNNLITHHLFNKFKLYWHPLECAKNLVYHYIQVSEYLGVCQSTADVWQWGDGPPHPYSFVLHFRSELNAKLPVSNHNLFSFWHFYLMLGNLSGLALNFKMKTYNFIEINYKFSMVQLKWVLEKSLFF